MATVTGITAAKALEILGESVVSGEINVSGHLILHRENGSSFDAGDVTLINSAETAAAIAAHSALDEGIHGLTGVGNDVVGTTKVQTLTNKTLASPVITGVGAEYYARRTTDLAKTSDAALAIDPVLKFAAEANARYKVEICARVKQEGATTGGSQWGMKLPSGLVKTVSYVGAESGSISGGLSASYNNHPSFVGSRIDLADSAVIDGLLHVGSGAGTFTWQITAFIETLGTAGDIGYMWAQHTSDTDATSLLAGSTLFAKRIA